MNVCIEVNDLLDELRQENSRLWAELSYAKHMNELLCELRHNLKQFNNNCKCVQTFQNKLSFNRLETKYKSMSKHFRHSFGHYYHKPSHVSLDQTIVSTKSLIKAKPEDSEERDQKLKTIEIKRQIIREIHRKKSKGIVYNMDKSSRLSGTGFDSIMKMKRKCAKKSKVMANEDCIECDLKFSHKKMLLNHIKTVHKEIFDTNGGYYLCSHNECHFKSDRLQKLIYHKMKHVGKQPFRCDWPGCEAGFYRNTHLVVHKTSHEGIRNFRCVWPSCDKTFRSNINLKNHYFIHTGEKPYLCEWPGCEARFRSMSSRNRHKVVHSTDTQYSCPECRKKFKFKGSLNRHFVIHNK